MKFGGGHKWHPPFGLTKLCQYSINGTCESWITKCSLDNRDICKIKKTQLIPWVWSFRGVKLVENNFKIYCI
jgi:hypothetical protein